MKKILEMFKKALWLQIIATACVAFLFALSVGNALSAVQGTENYEEVSIAGDFEESGAFGNWEEFSDFYEESYQPVVDTPSKSESEVLEEVSEESSVEVSEESNEDVSTEISEPETVITPGVSFEVAESAEASEAPEVSVEPVTPEVSVTEEPIPDSPMNAPSFTTEGFNEQPVQ